MGLPGRLRGFGRCCAALLAWLLGLVALPAIGPELPSTDDQVVAPVPAVNEELPAQRLVVLIAHRPQAPPAGLEVAASSFSQLPAGALRAPGLVVVIVATCDYDGTRVHIRGYVGTSDPVNRWDPSGLAWLWNPEKFDWEWDPNPRYEIPDPDGGPGQVLVYEEFDGPNPGDQFKPTVIPGNGQHAAWLPATNRDGVYNPEYLNELRGGLSPWGDGLIEKAGGTNAYFGHLDGIFAQLYRFSFTRTGSFQGFSVGDAGVANDVLTEYAGLLSADAPPAISGAAVMDGVQGSLDAAGFFPGLGAIPDLLNGGIYLLRGEGAEALVSLAAAVPAAGDTFKGVRVTDEMVAGARTLQRRAAWVQENQGLVRALENAGGPLSGRAMDVIQSARAETTLAGKVRILRQGDVFNVQQRRHLIENFVICFPAGTQVVTRDGPKAIESLEIGDEVLSWDEASGEQGYRPVVRTFENQTDELVHLRVQVNGEARLIRCTAEHPFWTDAHGWVRAAGLTTGMQVDLADGENAAVMGVTIQQEACAVYNVEVEGWHTYYVLPDGVVDVESAVLAHNRCGELLSTLRQFRSQRFRAGGQVFQLDRSGLRHILERHHPRYWTGQSKATQTFFDRSLTGDDISGIARAALRENRERAIRIGAGIGQLPPVSVDGIRYVVGLNRGRVAQIYPLP